MLSGQSLFLNVLSPRTSFILQGSTLLQSSVVCSIETQPTTIQAGNTRIVRRLGHEYQFNNFSMLGRENYTMYRMLYCGSLTPTCVLSGRIHVYSLHLITSQELLSSGLADRERY